MKNCTFGTAINCIDGRTQEPVVAFFKKRFAVDYIDMVTEPGVDKVLSQYTDKQIIASIKKRVQISIKKHNSKIIAIAGHYGCAGNPVDIKRHLKHIKKAVQNVDKWDLGVPVYGAWVDKSWKVILL